MTEDENISTSGQDKRTSIKERLPEVTRSKKSSSTDKDNTTITNEKRDDGEKNKRKRHASEESEISLTSLDQYIPTPPDGGWGWVIVIASCFCNLIVDGIGYSFGVFLTKFVDEFQAPKSKVSMVGSLLCGTYLFAGPAVSAMTNKFGCRAVVIAGSIVATLAFVLATFSPGVDMLIVTYGVMGGFGLGMVYLPSIVSVGYYFEKKRAFATGLAVCGSGFGTFIFPPLSEFLLEEYNWEGALLIIAGMILNCCIFGAMMRPLLPQKHTKHENAPKEKKPREKTFMDRLKESKHRRDRTISENSAAVGSVGDTSKILERVMQAKLLREKQLQDNDSDLGSLPSVAFVKRMDSLGTGDHRRVSGNMAVPTDGRRNKLSISSTAESVPSQDAPGSPVSEGASTPKIMLEIKGQYFGEYKDGQISPDPESATSTERSDYFTPPVTPASTVQNTPIKEMAKVKRAANGRTMSESDAKRVGQNGSLPFSTEFAPLLEVPAPVFRKPTANPTTAHGGSRTNMSHLHSIRSLHVSKKDLARPMYRKDIFYSGSIVHIPQFRSQPDMKSYITSITTIPGEMEFIDGPSPSSRFFNKFCFCLPRSVRDVLSEMVDISLLKDPSFMLICFGNITAFLGFYIPFMFLVDRAVSLGVSKGDAAFLISIIGITNTGGRVLVGKLADLRLLDSLMISYISIGLCGVVTAAVPFCNTYPLLAANAALFGLCVAAFISLSSIVICDLMGIEKLTNAFGLLAMVRGIAGMAGPPLAGFLYDSSGNYDLSFYLGGLLLFSGAACHVLLHIPCLRPKVDHNLMMEGEIGEELKAIVGSQPQIVSVEEVDEVDHPA